MRILWLIRTVAPGWHSAVSGAGSTGQTAGRARGCCSRKKRFGVRRPDAAFDIRQKTDFQSEPKRRQAAALQILPENRKIVGLTPSRHTVRILIFLGKACSALVATPLSVMIRSTSSTGAISAVPVWQILLRSATTIHS